MLTAAIEYLFFICLKPLAPHSADLRRKSSSLNEFNQLKMQRLLIAIKIQFVPSLKKQHANGAAELPLSVKVKQGNINAL